MIRCAGLRALIDYARVSGPQIDERMAATVDARHAKPEVTSDNDREFIRIAKSYLALLTTPRASEVTQLKKLS